jgi:hypothetical protein
MFLASLRRVISRSHRSSEPGVRPQERSATGEVEALESYLRDDLSDRLYLAAIDWLSTTGDDCVYVVGEARGSQSHKRHAGIAEVIRLGDGRVRVSAVQLDERGYADIGHRLSVELGPELNVAVRAADVVELGWLGTMLSSANGGRRVGPSAYQLVMEGALADVLD